jgi:hypothetical protein
VTSEETGTIATNPYEPVIGSLDPIGAPMNPARKVVRSRHRPDGGRAHADRNTQRATVDDALAEGTADELLTDADFLIHAHPDLVQPLLFRFSLCRLMGKAW